MLWIVSALEADFWKRWGEKRGTKSKIFEQPLLSQEGVLQRSQCPFTNLHWSALSNVVHASGDLPRNPAIINQPWTESKVKKTKQKKPLFHINAVATITAEEAFSWCIFLFSPFGFPKVNFGFDVDQSTAPFSKNQAVNPCGYLKALAK